MFKEAKQGTPKVITSNRLDDGLVVFLTADGGWSLNIADARLLHDGPDLDQALAYGKAQHDAQVVIDPYAIDVRETDAGPVPTRLRERIRADRGPTVPYGEAERDVLAGRSGA